MPKVPSFPLLSNSDSSLYLLEYDCRRLFILLPSLLNSGLTICTVIQGSVTSAVNVITINAVLTGEISSRTDIVKCCRRQPMVFHKRIYPCLEVIFLQYPAFHRKDLYMVLNLIEGREISFDIHQVHGQSVHALCPVLQCIIHSFNFLFKLQYILCNKVVKSLFFRRKSLYQHLSKPYYHL